MIIPWVKPPFKRRRAIITANDEAGHVRPMRAETRERLIKGIAKAQVWWQHLLTNKNASLADLAADYKLSEKSLRSKLSLAFLAPDIVEATFAGTLPRSLTTTQMLDLPSDWAAQRRVLNIQA